MKGNAISTSAAKPAGLDFHLPCLYAPHSCILGTVWKQQADGEIMTQIPRIKHILAGTWSIRARVTIIHKVDRGESHVSISENFITLLQQDASRHTDSQPCGRHCFSSTRYCITCQSILRKRCSLVQGQDSILRGIRLRHPERLLLPMENLPGSSKRSGSSRICLNRSVHMPNHNRDKLLMSVYRVPRRCWLAT